MAVQFERNANLEEIDSDALFGIEYLAHQTTGQKIVLWGNVLISIACFVVMELVYDVSVYIAFPIIFVFLFIGFMFGANQCEYLSIAEYLKLLFFNKSKFINFKSSEDVSIMKAESKVLKNEQELKQKEEASATPEGQKRSLILVIVLTISILAFVLIMSGVKSVRDNNSIHHSVGILIQNGEMF